MLIGLLLLNEPAKDGDGSGKAGAANLDQVDFRAAIAIKALLRRRRC